MPETPDAKLAVLIDADNAQPAGSAALVAEIAKFGVASVKRVYGDWTTPNLRSWKDAANKTPSSRSSSSPTRPAKTPPTAR